MDETVQYIMYCSPTEDPNRGCLACKSVPKDVEWEFCAGMVQWCRPVTEMQTRERDAAMEDRCCQEPSEVQLCTGASEASHSGLQGRVPRDNVPRARDIPEVWPRLLVGRPPLEQQLLGGGAEHPRVHRTVVQAQPVHLLPACTKAHASNRPGEMPDRVFNDTSSCTQPRKTPPYIVASQLSL